MAIVRRRVCMNTGDFADMVRVYSYTNAEIENTIEIERVSPFEMFQQVGQASGAGGADKSNVAITWSSKRKPVFFGGGGEDRQEMKTSCKRGWKGCNIPIWAWVTPT